MTKSFLLIAILLVISPSICLMGQTSNESSYEEEQKDQHAANEYKGLEIINQHGPIFVSGWAKDSIAIEVHISVSAPGEEMAQEVLDKITIVTSEKNHNLVYQTQIGEEFYFNYPFTIEYHVSSPYDTPLKIQNRFGDITLSSLTGPLEINLEYGHLIHHGMESVTRLKAALSFADASLVNLSLAEINLSNAQLNLNSADSLNISGHFCQTTIGKARDLNINVSTGRFKIGRVQNLVISGKDNFPSINEITQRGKIEIQNGLVLIKKVSDQLQELTVSNINAPLNLTLQPQLNYTLHGEVKNGQFRHYQAQRFKVIKDRNTLSFSGINGTLEKSATILLFNEDADININH